MLIGQGVIPAGYHPLADAQSPSEVTEMLALLRRSVVKLVADMPSHDAFIAQHCKAS